MVMPAPGDGHGTDPGGDNAALQRCGGGRPTQLNTAYKTANTAYKTKTAQIEEDLQRCAGDRPTQRRGMANRCALANRALGRDTRPCQDSHHDHVSQCGRPVCGKPELD